MAGHSFGEEMESRKKLRDEEGAKSLSTTKAGAWVCCHGYVARVKVCGEDTAENVVVYLNEV